MVGKRKIFFLPLSAVALALAFASLAFACTDVHGFTQITRVTHSSTTSAAACAGATDSCAGPGDTIKVKADSNGGGDGPLRYVAGSNNLLIDYYLYLLPHGETTDDNMLNPTCMPGAGASEAGSTSVPMMQLTDQPVHATGGGSTSVIPETTVKVPYLSGTHLLGPAWVCFMGGGYLDGQNTARDKANNVSSRFLAMNSTVRDTLQIVLI